MEEIKKLVLEVLRDGFVISLGTVDSQGVWVADVVYVYEDDLSLYWISVPSARHSKAIAARGNVAGTIRATFQTDKERALQISGKAERISGTLFELEKKLQNKRGVTEPKSPGKTLKDGYVWYKLTPHTIYLIYNEKFGYKRKQLRIS